MYRFRKTLGVVAIVLLSGPAFSSMPVLTPSPNPATSASCTEWATQQDEDAIYMWGMTESGESSKGEAIQRLIGSCLGREVPDIVGWGSSVGFEERYCKKHARAPICVKRKGTNAATNPPTQIRGKVTVGTTNSAIGDYSLINDTAVARKIFSACKMDDICEIEATMLSGVIVEVESATKITEPAGPPPADAVLDNRFACLYGSMEGEKVSTKARLAACDAWGEIESKAINTGYCWNQMHAQYMTCG